MDDFGIGCSSLATSDASLHTLKVDREFVNEVTTDPKDGNHRVGSSARDMGWS